MHRNNNVTYKAMEMTVTSAIGLSTGLDKPGLRLVKVNKNKISHEYYPLEDVPATVSLE